MPGDHEPLTDALLDPATYAGDLHVTLQRLRRQCPLAWNATAGFWAVTRHADVSEASSDPSRFCSGKGILVEEIGVSYDSPPTMMHADPPSTPGTGSWLGQASPTPWCVHSRASCGTAPAVC